MTLHFQALLNESAEELYENAPCGYIFTLPTGSIVKVNRTFLLWTQYDRQEALAGMHLQDLMTVGSRIFYETTVAPLLILQGFVNEINLDLRRKDGVKVPVLINSAQLKDAQGQTVFYRTTFFNISDRKLYERELVGARSRAEQSARRLRVLARAGEILAQSLDSTVLLQTLAKFLVQELADGCVINLWRDNTLVSIAAEHGNPAKGQMLATLPATPFHSDPLHASLTQGRVLLFAPEEGHASPYVAAMQSVGTRSLLVAPLGKDGKLTGILSLLFTEEERAFSPEDADLTQELAQHAALAVDNAQLFMASQMALTARDDLMSICSHELKTPLASLKLQAQLGKRKIARGDDSIYEPVRVRKMVHDFDRQVSRLSRLVDDMLDLTRIQGGKLALYFETTNLLELIHEVVDRFIEELQAAGCTVTVQAPQQVVGTWDRYRIEQVLINLVTNAIKYGAGKPIEIFLEEQEGHALLRVCDHGMGISARDHKRIFQRFERAVSVNEISGLGLGLYIVKQIVAAHTGDISVQSQLNQGSTFLVKLPLQRPTPPQG